MVINTVVKIKLFLVVIINTVVKIKQFLVLIKTKQSLVVISMVVEGKQKRTVFGGY